MIVGIATEKNNLMSYEGFHVSFTGGSFVSFKI